MGNAQVLPSVQVQPAIQVAVAQCPSDFDTTGNQSCQIKCPSGFKTQRGGSGENDSCVHETNNAYSVPIYSIAPTASTSVFEGERSRFRTAFEALQSRISEDESAERALQTEMGNYSSQVTEYDAIQSKYSMYNNIRSATNSLKDTLDTLKPPRPPTAPNMRSDIEVERRNILDIVSQKLLMVQVALVTILICVVEYVVLPAEYAHKLAFLTASVGLGVGIFLMSKK